MRRKAIDFTMFHGINYASPSLLYIIIIEKIKVIFSYLDLIKFIFEFSIILLMQVGK